MSVGDRQSVRTTLGRRSFRLEATVSFGMAATLILLLSVAGCGRTITIEHGPYTALGEVAAKATSRLLEDKGTVVLLVSEADNNAPTAIGVAVKAFGDTLKQVGNVQVAATEIIKPAVPVAVSGAEPLTPRKFAELLSKHATADALVSFIGVPRLTVEQIRQLPNPRPKVVAVVTFNPPTKAMFAQGVVHLAVLARPAVDAAGRTPQTVQEWFDMNYRIVTAATAAAALAF